MRGGIRRLIITHTVTAAEPHRRNQSYNLCIIYNCTLYTSLPQLLLTSLHL